VSLANRLSVWISVVHEESEKSSNVRTSVLTVPFLKGLSTAKYSTAIGSADAAPAKGASARATRA
jgi:hypothetical protein